jgi:hypothetical protein
MSVDRKYRENAAATSVLIEAGIDLMRENIKRRNAGAPALKIENLLRDWLNRSDDTVPGDTAGAVRIRSRVA